ncbi:MAG: hypothetical protein U0Z53_16305 [Blastocatellia bacterium]
MNDFFQATDNFINHVVDSFWASLPEETANDLAQCKKDVLTRIRSAVDSMVDQEINATDHHLENARRMREQYRHSGTASDNPPPHPA